MPRAISASELEITENAAGWFVRINDAPLDPPSWQEFEVWLAADPRHVKAYEDIGRLWQRSGQLAEVKRSGGRIDRRQLLMLAGFGLAGTLAGAFALRNGADVETGRGEIRSIALPDGSVIELSAASRIDIAFDTTQRRIDLIDGEVFVTVTAESLPFRVVAGEVAVTALGTAFAVDRRANSVRTLVTEHSVMIAAAGSALEVSEGYAIGFDRDGFGAIEPIRDGIDLAWRGGRLSFANAPLDEVVASLNRWRQTQLVVMPGIGNPTVTLIGEIDGLDRMTAHLANAISARLVEVGPWMTLLMPA